MGSVRLGRMRPLVVPPTGPSGAMCRMRVLARLSSDVQTTAPDQDQLKERRNTLKSFYSFFYCSSTLVKESHHRFIMSLHTLPDFEIRPLLFMIQKWVYCLKWNTHLKMCSTKKDKINKQKKDCLNKRVVWTPNEKYGNITPIWMNVCFCVARVVQ